MPDNTDYRKMAEETIKKWVKHDEQKSTETVLRDMIECTLRTTSEQAWNEAVEACAILAFHCSRGEGHFDEDCCGSDISVAIRSLKK